MGVKGGLVLGGMAKRGKRGRIRGFGGLLESHPLPVAWKGEAEDPASSQTSCPTTTRMGCWLGW